MFDPTSNTTLMKSLACVALNPALRTVLIFDAPYRGLLQVADVLEQLLSATTTQPIRQYHFSSFVSDDDVWGSLELPGHRRVYRLFSPERQSQELQLLTIADLATLSLAAARTCVMLIGADIVHLERHHQHQRWRPRQCWLASCSQEMIGAVSPHLLDRFALRLSWQDIISPPTSPQKESIADLLTHVPQEPLNGRMLAPPVYTQQITTALHRQVEVPAEALPRALSYMPSEEYYPRRELALIRFAYSLAQLAGATLLSKDHIDEAAHILGLVRHDEPRQEETPLADTPEPINKQPDLPALEKPAPPPLLLGTTTSASQTRLSVEFPPSMQMGLIVSWPLCSDPYPEDSAPVEREAAALRLPFIRSSTSHPARGPIFGVEESDSFSDLAIVSTILAASWKQKLRSHPQGGMVFEREDLRRYRRGALPEFLLMLLLDYTSVREKENWQAALYDYVREAYVKRASVTIIKVGEKQRHATDELRAEVVNAKSILVPRVSSALEAVHGRATPLAHGLSLAADRLHHALQQGRGVVRQVTFVVLSDGRGNVPLQASRQKHVSGIVSREGIDDALTVALRIKAMKRINATVLNPQPAYYPTVPEQLAEALGATLLPLSTVEDDGEVRP